MIGHFLISLLLTIIIELCVAICLNITEVRYLKRIIWINCITSFSINGIVYSLSSVFSYSILYYLIVPILEVVVFIVEGYYYKKTIQLKVNPFLISFILNIASYGCGLIYTILFIK